MTHSARTTAFRLAATLAVGAGLNALAALPAAANPPEPASKQMKRMAPFVDFVTHMYAGTQWCCDLGDGRMGDGHHELEEQIVDDPDGGQHYRVFLTRAVFEADSRDPKHRGAEFDDDFDVVIPPEGKWLDIPPGAVVRDKDILGRCAPDSATCAPPGANVLWLNMYTGQAFCYWPIHRWTMRATPAREPFRPAVPLPTGNLPYVPAG